MSPTCPPVTTVLEAAEVHLAALMGPLRDLDIDHINKQSPAELRRDRRVHLRIAYIVTVAASMQYFVPAGPRAAGR